MYVPNAMNIRVSSERIRTDVCSTSFDLRLDAISFLPDFLLFFSKIILSPFKIEHVWFLDFLVSFSATVSPFTAANAAVNASAAKIKIIASVIEKLIFAFVPEKIHPVNGSAESFDFTVPVSVTLNLSRAGK